MTNIDVGDELYIAWKAYYELHSKVEYPSLKNFTNRKLKELMGDHWQEATLNDMHCSSKKLPADHPEYKKEVGADGDRGSGRFDKED